MSEYAEVKWRSFADENPPHGVRVLLKMEDHDKNVAYAIGITDVETGKLWLSAKEKGVTEPIQWMLIPD
jgi:hypothetical protein